MQTNQLQETPSPSYQVPRYSYKPALRRITAKVRRDGRHVGWLTNFINYRRMERGMTQAELSVRSGISRKTLNSIEANRTDPKLSIAMALAKALDVTVDDLFKSS